LRYNNIRKIENLHIIFWLVKDFGWVQDIHLLGMIMVFPTLIIALWLTWQMRADLAECAHNVAVCCWITANSIWMAGEFFFEDGTRPVATIFFSLGIAVLVTYYGWLYFVPKKVVEH
jgi:hypothetical protein